MEGKIEFCDVRLEGIIINLGFLIYIYKRIGIEIDKDASVKKFIF